MDFKKLTRNRQDFLNLHSKPVNRRDFLSLGLVAGAGMALWSPKSLFANEMQDDLPAFIVIDLAGGAGLSGNFLVGKKAGPEDLLAGYKSLGWNPRVDGWDSRFGAPLAKSNISKLFKGIVETASDDAQKNFRMGTILNISDDDTTSNPLSVAHLAYKASYKDYDIKHIIGNSSSHSGGFSQFATPSELRASSINSVDNLKNLVGTKELYPNQENSLHVFNFLKSFSSRQLRNFNGSAKLIKSYDELISMASSNLNVDPREIQAMNDVFSINENTSADELSVVQASIVFNSLLGQTGPGVITIGGCDYHDGTSETGDAKDEEVGVLIGRIIESAKRLKKKVFIQVITDGGVDSIPGSRKWRGDSGNRSMSAIGYYSPDGAIEMTGTQLGAYTNSEAVDTSTFIGGSPQKAGLAAFANYLSVCGKVGDFSKYAGTGLFTPKELEASLLMRG